MKQSLLAFSFIGILMAAAISIAGQQPITAKDKRSADEVMAVVAKWADAVRDRDLKTLGSIFDEDAIITTYDGKTRGKSAELDAMKPDPNVRFMSIVNEDVRLRVYGDVTVVTALTMMKTAAAGKEAAFALRYTTVFVKRGGKWRIVALQTARAPQSAGS